MIKNLIFFDKEEDLQQLTGLLHDELWKAGFNLDDWDLGFVTEGLPVEQVPDEWDENTMNNELRYWRDDVPFCISNILSNWENYCVGYKITEYNGKQYFMLYHS